MKIIHKNPVKQKDNIEINVKKQQQSEYSMIGQVILKPGLILWEFDWGKMEIKKAEIKKANAIDFETGLSNENKKAIHNPKSYYFQCHSQKAAVKKINKLIKNVVQIENYFSIKDKQIVSNY
jgi:hypothetical protein